MTDAERLVLVLTADLLAIVTGGGPSTAVQSATRKLIAARAELDGESYRLAQLTPEPADPVLRS